MSRLFTLAIGILTVAAVVISAQAIPKEYAEMVTAMQTAQARAMRPGDEALSCAALERELVSSMNAPAVQAYAEKSAAAQKNATTAEKTRTPMTPQAAAALAASLGAGGGFPTGLAASPDFATQAQAAQKLQAEQMKQMIPVIPQIMRSQRLMQLTFVKQCTWVVGASPFVPPVPVR